MPLLCPRVCCSARSAAGVWRLASKCRSEGTTRCEYRRPVSGQPTVISRTWQRGHCREDAQDRIYSAVAVSACPRTSLQGRSSDGNWRESHVRLCTLGGLERAARLRPAAYKSERAYCSPLAKLASIDKSPSMQKQLRLRRSAASAYIARTAHAEFPNAERVRRPIPLIRSRAHYRFGR